MWGPLDVDVWAERRKGELRNVRQAVEGIIEAVRLRGDEALLELTKKFDKVSLSSVRVSEEEIEAAYEEVDISLVRALRDAAERISRFHELQRLRQNWMEELYPGVSLGVRLLPLERVGAYVPGGKASYPSTALMCIVPAKVAGVEEVAVCTPPPVDPLTLVALDVAGADEVFSVGGAQAVAALALGTESVRPVVKVVGPGNVYVTEAKLLLKDKVDIDFPAGPSEVLIIADSSARAEFVAADILAQAEHGPHSPCLLVTDDASLAERVGELVEEGARGSPRRAIIESSLVNVGYVLVPGMGEAAEVCNRLAPEHLSVQCGDPEGVLEQVRSAGSIFLGPYSPVAAGDYASGTNHVLPTAGYARLYSGLDVRHFCKATSVQRLTREGLGSLAPTIERLAKAEGLVEHARSVEVRLRRP
ncbi:MAG: histidinol dehydrogenase [Methanomassiliicoccales archaeon]|jgi:histidinol dehydrogenase|nr:histidinol dehydrogenase [Methanomassiliicoccales archaeon]